MRRKVEVVEPEDDGYSIGINSWKKKIKRKVTARDDCQSSPAASQP